ncbi:MAG: hypothetical protein ABSA52_23660 [Candidatus Binatia bacterium]|jgi:hypothetical protein
MTKRLLAIMLLIECSACVRSQYVPMRPVTIAVPTTDSGQACGRECMQTTQVCEKGCRPSYQANVLTEAPTSQVREAVEQCKDHCADQRDACLGTCK